VKSRVPEEKTSTLREFRNRQTVWIVTDPFEAPGRAAGLPDAVIAEKWLEACLNGDNPTSGRAPTRTETLANNQPKIHIRRSLHGGWLGPLWRGYRAGLGRLKSEIELTARLHAAGAPVPEPAFIIAKRDGILWRAAFCTVHIEDAVDAIRFLQSGPQNATLQNAAQAAGRAVANLHRLGLRHGDLHLGNLLIREQQPDCQAWVIDLDGSHLGPPLSAKEKRRQLDRLCRSLKKRGLIDRCGPEAQSAFLEGYSAACSD